MQTELHLVLKGLPAKERAKMLKALRVSERTLERWMENPGDNIRMDQATIIKERLDKYYQADHDMRLLCKPVRIHGRRSIAA